MCVCVCVYIYIYIIIYIFFSKKTKNAFLMVLFLVNYNKPSRQGKLLSSAVFLKETAAVFSGTLSSGRAARSTAQEVFLLFPWRWTAVYSVLKQQTIKQEVVLSCTSFLPADGMLHTCYRLGLLFCMNWTRRCFDDLCSHTCPNVLLTFQTESFQQTLLPSHHALEL